MGVGVGVVVAGVVGRAGVGDSGGVMSRTMLFAVDGCAGCSLLFVCLFNRYKLNSLRLMPGGVGLSGLLKTRAH